MVSILNLIADYKEHILFVLGLVSVFVEFKPTNKYKFWTNLFKWIGTKTNSELKDEIQELYRKVDENHNASMEAISDTNKNIDTVDNNRKQDNQAILKDRITQMYYYYVDKGYILEKDKMNFNTMFTRYILSGGNSYVKDDIAPFINSLPRFLSHTDAKNFYEQHGNYNNGTEDK